jgi:hypothetical protein
MMAGKGAPKENKYAQKEDEGKTISIYLKAEDMELLRLVLIQNHEEPTDGACVSLAKKAAKNGINGLLLPHRYKEAQNQE